MITITKEEVITWLKPLKSMKSVRINVNAGLNCLFARYLQSKLHPKGVFCNLNGYLVFSEDIGELIEQYSLPKWAIDFQTKLANIKGIWGPHELYEELNKL